MLSSNPYILELLALLKAHGVRDLVLCPGSRDAGIIHSALQIEHFSCHSIVDERSAGFFAIGLAQHLCKPVAVIVTSGSALANLYPAACEAYYQQIPVIFISADRPARWIGQMDGQTMPQDGALGRMVRMSVSLPTDNIWHANRLINEAILESRHRVCGPVHINIPIEEPIYDFSTEKLPEVRVISRIDDLRSDEFAGMRKRAHQYRRVLLVAGQMPYRDLSAIEAEHDWPNIIAENLSNLQPMSYTNAYRVDWQEMEPLDLVVTIGGHITSKELKTWMRQNPPREHWHVSNDGAVADVFGCMNVAIEAEATDFLQEMGSMGKPFCIPEKATEGNAVLTELFGKLPYHCCVHLANSTSVRAAQLCDLNVMHVCCNRGINGIEGSLSAAAGYAAAMPGVPVFVVIGDLSFFYDQNALWNTRLPDNLHILLMNNGGGGIFDTLPIPDEQDSRNFIQARHRMTARHIAAQYGVKYLTREDEMDDFINTREAVILEIGC